LPLPSTAIPRGLLNDAAVPVPFAEPDEPVPANVVTSRVPSRVVAIVMVGCPTTTDIKKSGNRILLRINHPFPKTLDLDGIGIRVSQLRLRHIL